MKQILYKLFEHQYLGRDEARTILQNIAQGKYNDAQVASLITVFLMHKLFRFLRCLLRLFGCLFNGSDTYRFIFLHIAFPLSFLRFSAAGCKKYTY